MNGAAGAIGMDFGRGGAAGGGAMVVFATAAGEIVAMEGSGWADGAVEVIKGLG